MPASPENVSMAVFCDFENVALGVRDANYEKFDIKPILERLLLKGSIVVKKSYCDWERYKGFKATMHEANFELIEIPHVRQSGKNSADIRLVVDALDLCYTKSHVNTFVIISGDSDFSPLVSKLRENAKQVIGVGVKQSTSDLLVANCDEFIFYDDLVRESRRAAAKREPREAQAQQPRRTPDEEQRRKDEIDKRKNQAIEIAIETFDALLSERGDSGKIWASVLKEAIKRRKPDFSESYYGFRAFGNLLEEAQARGLLEFGRDEKSGAYVYRSAGAAGAVNAEQSAAPSAAPEARQEARPEGRQESRRKGRGARKPGAYRDAPADHYATAQEELDEAAPAQREEAEFAAPEQLAAPEPVTAIEADGAPEPVAAAPAAGETRRRTRGGRKSAARRDEAAAQRNEAAAQAAAIETIEPSETSAPVAAVETIEPTTPVAAAEAIEPKPAADKPAAASKRRGARKPAQAAAEHGADATAAPVVAPAPAETPVVAAAPAETAPQPEPRRERPARKAAPKKAKPAQEIAPAPEAPAPTPAKAAKAKAKPAKGKPAAPAPAAPAPAAAKPARSRRPRAAATEDQE